ncbi:hypothetical protein C0J52_18983 [Blattella germanica]|nr:hypothetical protein C0J52_18983 [Blattella germanica]
MSTADIAAEPATLDVWDKWDRAIVASQSRDFPRNQAGRKIGDPKRDKSDCDIKRMPGATVLNADTVSASIDEQKTPGSSTANFNAFLSNLNHLFQLILYIRRKSDRPGVVQTAFFINSPMKHTFHLGKPQLTPLRTMPQEKAYNDGKVPINAKKIQDIQKYSLPTDCFNIRLAIDHFIVASRRPDVGV